MSCIALFSLCRKIISAGLAGNSGRCFSGEPYCDLSIFMMFNQIGRPIKKRGSSAGTPFGYATKPTGLPLDSIVISEIVTVVIGAMMVGIPGIVAMTILGLRGIDF